MPYGEMALAPLAQQQQVTVTNSLSLSGVAGADGWTSVSAYTFAYSSADSPTFVATTSADLSASIPVGARFKCVQSSTTLYFIVTAISASTITLYGGTDYTLANSAISSPAFALAKAAVGMLLDPTKWTQILVNDTSIRTQSSPTANTWYNAGSLTGNLPIGAWDVSFMGSIFASRSASGDTGTDGQVTLSTANNSESNTKMTAYSFTQVNYGTSQIVYSGTAFHRRDTIVVAAKTALYVNIRTTLATANLVQLYGSLSPTLVVARCAYL